MATPTFVPATVIFKEFDISRESLIRWADDGLIEIVRLPGSQKRLYNWEQLRTLLGARTGPVPARTHLAYARVSSDGQRADLERQIAFLRSTCGDNTTILSDIGSGLNYQRKHFSALLERVQQGTVESVTVCHRDRLCRYGIELVQQVFAFHKCRLVVLYETDQQSAPASREQELAQDLLAIVNVFVARNNGLRAGENRRRRKADTQAQAESKEDTGVSDLGSESRA